MKTEKKYFALFFFLLLFVAVAIITPKTLSIWYDSRTLGQLSYENMAYEPYNISPYHSFSDKLEAVAKELSQGTTIYQIKLREKSGALENQELIEIINTELKDLYENGILPQVFSIQNIEERDFYQAYVVPTDNAMTLLQDICFWKIRAETEDGWIMLTMDSDYHRIYAFRMYYYVEEIFDDTNCLMEIPSENLYYSLAEKWCKYWGLDDVKIENICLHEDEAGSNISLDGIFDASWEYGIVFPEGHQFYEWSWYNNFYGDGKSGEIWITGMTEFLP